MLYVSDTNDSFHYNLSIILSDQSTDCLICKKKKCLSFVQPADQTSESFKKKSN